MAMITPPNSDTRMNTARFSVTSIDCSASIEPAGSASKLITALGEKETCAGGQPQRKQRQQQP